ncbi:8062_t:CDS:2 [Ambispora leptoticha]|uniref:8062_t:CDS:1 n=1 Tax=Ambispora leptoticha TaxID=144679 RepID=A0A9N9B5B5_9GLOM|nr:8062_t:CDS:2 [Ambispora leptoticha]
MDITQILPSEVTIGLFKNLDAKNLCNLSLVSRNWNILVSDNHLWAEIALNRWENKQGMKEICTNAHSLWYLKPGTWKKVYILVEKEARRTKLEMEDLCETTWTFKDDAFENSFLILKDDEFELFNNALSAHAGSPKFLRNGRYVHEGMMDSTLPWKFTNRYVRVSQFPHLKPSRPDPTDPESDWGLKLKNVYVTFSSVDHTGFQRRLSKFNRELALEFGVDLPMEAVNNNSDNSDDNTDRSNDIVGPSSLATISPAELIQQQDSDDSLG